jgi:hypothetical protein
MKLLHCVCFVVACACLCAPLPAQRLLGVSGGAPLIFDFTAVAGAPCGQPLPFVFPTPFPMPPVCAGPVPGPIAAGALLGDIADNPLTDTVFVTDGFAIGEYSGDTACFVPPPGMLINNFPAPPMPGGALTGMGMDPTGAVTGGFPTLWVTDGFFLAGVMPSAPGTCIPPIFLFPPCPIPTPIGAPFTDVSWDPSTLTIWACDAAGFVHNIMPVAAGCVAVAAPFPAFTCALAGPLTGIAYDTNTPGVLAPAPALFVTDGFTVQYLTLGGGPAPAAFYAPIPCSPTPAPLAGLALSQRSVSYGAPRIVATLDSFGQASSPGPTFGIEISGTPPGSSVFLVAAINVPGPGFACPPLGAVGTTLWVSPPLLVILALGALPPGCVAIPLPIPAGAPTGVQVFMQAIMMAGGPPAADATNGLAFTLGPP